jgi:hypothetical protein
VSKTTRVHACDRLHQSGHDVTLDDWSEEVHGLLKESAAKTGSEDVNCVRPHPKTVKAIMQACDLRDDGGATKTGTTSSLVQTEVRASAGCSIRAVTAVAMGILTSAFPIESSHPRWQKFAEGMTDVDQMVCDAAECNMIPVQAALLSSTDATSGWFMLNEGPKPTVYPAQRQRWRFGDREEVDVDLSVGSDDEAAIQDRRAQVVNGVARPASATPPELPTRPTMSAPDHHTRGHKFSAARQAKRKAAEASTTTMGGLSVSMSFGVVRKC